MSGLRIVCDHSGMLVMAGEGQDAAEILLAGSAGLLCKTEDGSVYITNTQDLQKTMRLLEKQHDAEPATPYHPVLAGQPSRQDKVEKLLAEEHKAGYERGVREAIMHFVRLKAWVDSETDQETLRVWANREEKAVNEAFPFAASGTH